MKRKFLSVLLTAMCVCSTMFPVNTGASEEEIAAARYEKQAAESSLYAVQDNISYMESQKAALESTLQDLNTQYNALTEEMGSLSIQAAEKEETLKKLQSELKKAKKQSDEQYKNMKIRIAYIYENGGTTALEMLLSSEDISDFLNRAENIRAISEYDRDMLKRYQDLQTLIEEQKTAVSQEKASIEATIQERAAKQGEVRQLLTQTNESIASYTSQISADQAQAAALIDQISAADSEIAYLIQEAEAWAAAEAAYESYDYDDYEDDYDDHDYDDYDYDDDYGYDDYDDDDYGYDYEDDYDYDEDYDDYDDDYGYDDYDDYGYEESEEVRDAGSSYEEDSYDEYYEEDSYDEYDDYEEESYDEYYEEDSYEDEDYEEDSYEEDYSDSSSGTYLGNFTLTAYCNCAICCGTAGNLTASGTWPTAGNTVAMGGVPFGTQLLINGHVYTVEDRGTPYGHVDIFFNSHEEALQFGLQSADVYQLN